MKKQLSFMALAATLYTAPVAGDIYMHAPRGSNNRNCRDNANNTDRQNANRLFNSQNNNKGGYSCPRAYPFACYLDYKPGEGNQEARDQCNAKNTENPSKDMVDENGVKHPDAVNTPMQYYYSGSQLSIEWTNQHGMGTNGKLHSDVIIQYSCTEQLVDNCSEEEAAQEDVKSLMTERENNLPLCPSRVADQSKKLCKPRDGFPIANNGENLNRQATDTIPTTPEDQDDYRYGRHEGLQYYQECENRERNKGLFIADQNVNDEATASRKNPNADRYGLECEEESAYWPYWHHSPWKDIAVITSNLERCEEMKLESQNVQEKGRCWCGPECQEKSENKDYPNNESLCNTRSGIWCMDPAYDIEAPECIVGAFNRQNHLGNVAGPNGANTNQYNWTIPELPEGSQCVLRVRYNISTGDFDSVSVNGNYTFNGELSPLKDNDESEAASYRSLKGEGINENKVKFGYAVNTNQMGRVFQDRSYMFEVKPRPDDKCSGNIYNLGTRGKRGNIVQTYPSVEYDFTPQHMVVGTGDCVHIQYVGSDYNPNRAGNNGEGGPMDPKSENQFKADRHNIVQTDEQSVNTYVRSNVDEWDLFDASREELMRLAFLDQDLENDEECKTFEELDQLEPNNRDRREGLHQNCMKLSGVRTPYFDGGLMKVGKPGTYTYISTRNNNFSNRGQKGVIIVEKQWSGLEIAGLTAASVLGVGAIAYVGMAFAGGGIMAPAGFSKLRKRTAQSSFLPAKVPARPGSSGIGKAEALFDHEVSEAGELAFKVGDKITLTKKDESGWWEGYLKNGERGVFPGNYVKEV